MTPRLLRLIGGPGHSRWPVVAAITARVGGGAFAIAADRLYRDSLDSQERTRVAESLAPHANALRAAIDRRMAILIGVRTFVEVRQAAPGFAAEFERFAEALRGSADGIRGIHLAVDAVIRQSVPRAGNEAAIGFDLRQHRDSSQRVAYERAERSRAIVVTHGPLLQGDTGLVGRAAAHDAQGRVLAVVAVVLELGPVLAESGLDQMTALRFALRDDRGATIVGGRDIDAAGPVLAPIDLPDRRWTLAAIPADGWAASTAGRLRFFRGSALVLVAAFGLGASLLARRQVAEATETEARLRRTAEEKFARLVQLSPDGVALTRARDGLILDVNESFLQMGGFTRDEVVGRTAVELELWADPGERERLIELLRRDGVCRNLPKRFRRKNREVLECEFSSRLIEIEGEPCLLSFVRDTSERVALERQLGQSQKLEAVGRLAGGIAHDFNNIMTGVMGYAQMASDGVPEDSPVREDLREIVRAVGRASELTRQLLAFARRQVTQPRPVDVSACTQEAARLLERLVGESVQFRYDLAKGLPPVLIDPGQLEQVLVNLVVNARDAMPEGGSITIVTRAVDGHVTLEVKDTGIGIAPEHHAAIFDPFYTTKEQGQGTGLGLATVYGIVRQAGGHVEVASAAGQGASFKIRLPVHTGGEAGEVASRDPAASAGLPRGTETILVAEDEAQVRELSSRLLRGLGYRVIAAAHGKDALALAESFTGPIHLLVTDLIMPELGGRELIERLRARRPELRALFVSGYPGDLGTLERALADGCTFLAKPFQMPDLARAVRDALDGV